MLVLVDQDGPVTTMTINRPAVRNAVDGPRAEALAGGESLEGSKRFSEGAGRHGSFTE